MPTITGAQRENSNESFISFQKSCETDFFIYTFRFVKIYLKAGKRFTRRHFYLMTVRSAFNGDRLWLPRARKTTWVQYKSFRELQQRTTDGPNWVISAKVVSKVRLEEIIHGSLGGDKGDYSTSHIINKNGATVNR